MDGQAWNVGVISLPLDLYNKKISCNWNGRYEEDILTNNEQCNSTKENSWESSYIDKS